MSKVTPQNVHEIIGKHMLADGFDIVLDLEKSKGRHIYDSRFGKTYLDFFSCFATFPIGMNHPKMTTPEFIEKLGKVSINKPTNSDVYTVEMAEFIDTFYRVAMPDYMKYVFFIDGGALAVENALKASFDWKIRKNFAKGYKEEVGTQIIHFKDAFHGRSGYTVSMTNTFDPRKHQYFAKLKWPRVLNPKITFPLNEQNLEAVKKAEEESIKQIKDAIHNNKDDIAGIIIEPIQGEGGDNHFRKEFFQQIRTIADESDIMFIVDCVQVGVGITGKMWAHQNFDVKPDMIAFGKKMQVCGFMSSARIDEVPNNVFHESSRINSTWGGNLTDMVRAQKYLEIIEEEKLIDNAKTMGKYLLEKLLSIQQDFPKKIFNTRGIGLLCAFDLESAEERDKFRNRLYQNGMLILGCGEKTIRFRPPLDITKDEIDEGIEIIRKSL